MSTIFAGRRIFRIMLQVALSLLLTTAGYAQERVHVVSNTVGLYSVSFSGGVTVYWSSGKCKDDGIYSGQQWPYKQPQVIQYQTKDGPRPRNAPVCYIWGASPSVSATCWTRGFTTTRNLPVKMVLTTGDGQTLNYSGTGTFGPRGGSVSVTTGNSLASRITNTNISTTWSVSFDNGATFVQMGNGSTSGSPLYVVAGTPGGGNATKARLNFVTKNASGATNNNQIVSNLFTNFYSNTSYAGGAKPYRWAIPDGAPGECIDIIRSFSAAIQMAGGTTGTIVYVSANTTAKGTKAALVSNYPNLQQDTRNSGLGQSGHVSVKTNNPAISHAAVEALIFKDGNGAGNNFEACLLYNGMYYPGGAADPGPYATALQVLNAVAANAFWAMRSTPFALCVVPGPSPQW